MRNKYRELEYKYTLNEGYEEAFAKLVSIYSTDILRVLSGKGTDLFWLRKGVDFIRARTEPNDPPKGFLTLKKTDRGKDISNRMEIDIEVMDINSVIKYNNFLLGDPVFSITKAYHILYLKDAVVSVYTTNRGDQVFLEVEANNQVALDAHAAKVIKELDMERTYISLLDYFYEALV